MATKRKTKTEVTYEVEWSNGREWHSDLSIAPFTRRLGALRHTRIETQRLGLAHRIVRVERTVVAEVKP